MLTLEFSDGAGHTEFIGSQGLYGISTDPTTYCSLAPQQSVRIRIGGKVHLEQVIVERSSEKAKQKLLQEFVVTASFDLDDSSLWNPCKKLRSTNQVLVRVTEK